MPPKRSAVTRIVAAGGAVACIGVAYEAGTPIAEAFSIVIPLGDANGTGNTITINILEGNIFDPQLGILGGNVSNNSTIGNVAAGNGNGVTTSLTSGLPMLGGAAGNGNTVQINILSYNIFNPQLAIGGGNVSNNTTVSNVAIGNGNNSSTKMTSPAGFWTTWVSGMTGNGNTMQVAFGSGNIFNPQWGLGGENVSNNTAITNVAAGNGNYSQTQYLSAGFWGTTLFGGMTGNGNTNQTAGFVSNIVNPQLSFGGGNTSNNTAISNASEGNGNNSDSEVGPSGGLGTASIAATTGNGNTTQTATGAGNIYNDQWHMSVGLKSFASYAGPAAGSVGSQSSAGAADSELSEGAAGSVSSAGSFSSRIRGAVDRTLGVARTTPSGPASFGAASDPSPAGFGPSPAGSGPSPADSGDKADE